MVLSQGSVDRGTVWKIISEALNAMEQPLFKVNECTTRDGLNLLMKQLKINDNEEKRALGIEVEEEGELDKGFRDIVELFDDSERRS